MDHALAWGEREAALETATGRLARRAIRARAAPVEGDRVKR